MPISQDITIAPSLTTLPQQREFDRLLKTCEGENVKLPLKRQVEKKAMQIQKLTSQPLTEVRFYPIEFALGHWLRPYHRLHRATYPLYSCAKARFKSARTPPQRQTLPVY